MRNPFRKPPIVAPLPKVVAFLGPMYKIILHPKLSFKNQRRLMTLAAVIQPVPLNTRKLKITIDGVPVERVTVGDGNPSRAIVYLHGGSYTVGSPYTHRPLTATLAEYTDSVVYVVDYRLAPEHPYPAGLDDAETVWDALIAHHGYTPGRLSIAGDSAGGGLAAALARRVVDKGEDPSSLVLLAPWVDPVSVSPELKRDLVVNTGWSGASAKAYLGDGDPYDPGYAPMRSRLEGLPPTIVHAATTELLHDEVVEFVGRLRAAKVDVTYTEYPDLWHVAHLQATIMREADEAVRDLARFITARFDATAR